jgi:hypothetical protein
MSILEQVVHVYSKDKQARSTLKIGSPCPFWRLVSPCPLDFGSSCLHSEEWTVLIYTGGRQPCPFWRQVAMSILEAGSP